MIHTDRNLSQRLERTEARSNAAFVEARAKLSPEIGAQWIEVAGAYAMFDGVGSPCTQTFGLGVFAEASPADLEQLESFFHGHKASVCHEISPMTDATLLPLLNERGYQPIDLSSVLFQSIDGGNSLAQSVNPNITTRIIEVGEEHLWAQTAAAGWAPEGGEIADFILGFGHVSAHCEGGFPFLAEIDGKAIASGMLFMFDGVALMAGASTVPDYRRQGAQHALLDARLRYAGQNGCTIAMFAAAPGSQSQRNAEKNGFRIAYTRTKWMLKT